MVASKVNENRNENKRDEEQQHIEKLVSVRRVTKVVKGGKNMRFSALVVVGDGKGKISYATAKAREVPDAIKKAVARAKRTMVRVPLKLGRTVHHDFVNRKCASRVCIRSAKPGTGVIAGGPMRSIFEVIGLQDVVAKGLGSNNSHSVVCSTVRALQQMESPRMVAQRRGLSIAEINHRKKVLLNKTWMELQQ